MRTGQFFLAIFMTTVVLHAVLTTEILAAPEIATITEPACNGEVIVMTGEGLDPTITRVKALYLGTENGSFHTETTADPSQLAASIDQVPQVPVEPPKTALDCEVLGGGERYLQVALKSVPQPWINVPVVTAVWAGDGRGWSRPYVVNRPKTQWLSPTT